MIRIGKIVATHGLQGSLVLTHIVGNSKWLKKEDALFVEMQKDSYIPFFVSLSKANNKEEYVISLEDVNSVEAARRMIGKHVYVKEEVVINYAQDSPLLWVGFKVMDKQKGELGILDDVMQTPTQWLGKVAYKDSEVLIPLIEQTITLINMKTRTLFVDLPEGLVEVYTG